MRLVWWLLARLMRLLAGNLVFLDVVNKKPIRNPNILTLKRDKQMVVVWLTSVLQPLTLVLLVRLLIRVV